MKKTIQMPSTLFEMIPQWSELGICSTKHFDYYVLFKCVFLLFFFFFFFSNCNFDKWNTLMLQKADLCIYSSISGILKGYLLSFYTKKEIPPWWCSFGSVSGINLCWLNNVQMHVLFDWNTMTRTSSCYLLKRETVFYLLHGSYLL